MLHALPDPDEIKDAGGVDCQQKTLKAMMVPAMDDADALPSSFITRVLTALGKWSAKLQTVIEFFESVEPTMNTKSFLNFIGYI